MVGFVKLIGIIMLVAGVVYFVKPNSMKKMADFFAKEKWIYAGGALSFVIGIALLRAASKCAISWIVVLFGIAALIKGTLVFVLSKQKIESLLNSLTKKNPKALRAIAIVYIVLGVVLIYSV